jgi:hypothetical protein
MNLRELSCSVTTQINHVLLELLLVFGLMFAQQVD